MVLSRSRSRKTVAAEGPWAWLGRRHPWPSILEQIPPSPVQRTVKGLDISPGLTRTRCGQPERGPGHTNRRSKLREGTK